MAHSIAHLFFCAPHPGRGGQWACRILRPARGVALRTAGASQFGGGVQSTPRTAPAFGAAARDRRRREAPPVARAARRNRASAGLASDRDLAGPEDAEGEAR